MSVGKIVSSGRGILVAAILAASFATPSTARAATCYTEVSVWKCDCTGCLYLVICGVRLGAPPSLDIQFCQGNNGGILVSDVAPAASGYSDYSCSYGNSCGTATAVGTCCGGARLTFQDWRVYTTCRTTGTPCGGASAPQ